MQYLYIKMQWIFLTNPSRGILVFHLTSHLTPTPRKMFHQISREHNPSLPTPSQRASLSIQPLLIPHTLKHMVTEVNILLTTGVSQVSSLSIQSLQTPHTPKGESALSPHHNHTAPTWSQTVKILRHKYEDKNQMIPHGL